MFLPDAQQALGFVVSQTSHIEATVYEEQYPEIQYDKLIPIDTSANEWAKSVTYYSMNKVGAAGWFHHYAKDIHVADSERAKHEVGVEMADIGYRWSLEEIGQAMMTGTPLQAERAAAARRAYEEFMDEKALFGDADKGIFGLLNYPGITTTTVPADGGDDDETSWAMKSVDQILRDFNAALTGIMVDSLQVEMADTVLLPLQSLNLLAQTRLGSGDGAMTLLDFIATKNVYTFQTGRPLLIRAVRGLETAGEGGVGRMIVYRRDPQVLKMHVPMPHRFMPVWQTGPLVFDVPGIFRLAGVEVRRPGAFRYVDGIMDANYE
jgi:hypothetical protein